MSKNLRVFFLSVLVVVLAWSSAFAAETITIDGENNTPTYYVYAPGSLTINKDGIFVFKSSDVDISTLSFDKASNVTLYLPAPATDNPAYGTKMKSITFPTKDAKGNALSKTNRAKIAIEKAGTNAAILASDDLTFNVTQFVDFTINAPFRVNADSTTVKFNPTVEANATLTLGPKAEVYTNTANLIDPTGFLTGSTSEYTIENSGNLIVQNQWAIKGSGLTVKVKEGGSLTFDLEQSTLDLRGRGEKDGAKITENGGNINVNKDLKLIGAFTAGNPAKFVKTGTATLTLSQGTNGTAVWPTSVLSKDFETVVAKSGTLVLDAAKSGSPIWAAKDGALFSSDVGALEARTGSISEEGTSLTFHVKGTAKFAKHAIVKGVNEIYPYDDFRSFNNGIRIDLKGVTLSLDKAGTVTIDDGAFALESLAGKGTVVINNASATQDKTVLIFTSPDKTAGYTEFAGTIKGTNANVGLYAATENDKPYSGDILGKANVEIDNLIVYGPAKLGVSKKTKLSNVKNIYLRGHRPGAKNFKDDGSVNTDIATSELTVGGLVFVHSDDKEETIELTSNIKIDGTANSQKMARFTIKGMSLDVKITSIDMFANKGAGKDFPSAYAKPDKGIYAMTFDGSVQPSRFTVSGITGEGLAADVANTTNKVYQILIMQSSDVKFTVAEGEKAGTAHHPLGTNTSLYVGKNAKVEMGRGAVIDGHLTFEGSSAAVNSAEYSSKDNYPQEDWFASGDNKWNLESLDNYSTFTTVVAKNNRMKGDSASDTSEYAVLVKGDVTFSSDKKVTPGTTAYPGLVLVRTKANTTAFDGVTDTTLQRFKIVGTTGTTSKYVSDFLTVYDPTYAWRISATSLQSNAKGVVVENRNELALLKFGEFGFTSGAEAFGNGEFVARADVTAWAKGEKLTITRNTSTSSTLSKAKYVLSRGNDKYYISKAEVLFRRNVEGEESAMSNIFDEKKWTSTFSSPDVLMNGDFRIADDGTPEVELRGSSYGGYKFVDLTVMLKLTGLDGDEHTLNIAGIIPAYKDAPLSPRGLGDKYSTAHTYALEPYDFVEKDGKVVRFAVPGLRKSTNNATPQLVNGSYVWNVNAVDGTYFLPDENGVDTRISSIKLIRFDGTDLNDAEPVYTEENPEIKVDSEPAVVSVSSSALGTTGSQFVATKWLAIEGTKADGSGTLKTQPVAYTLVKATSDNVVTVESLNKSVQIGGDSVSGVYDINPGDFSGKITLEPVGEFPAWLGYNGGGETISYKTGDLTGVTPGAHTFRVIAHDDTKHKAYEFTVTVEKEPEPVTPHIDGEAAVAVVVGGEAKDLKLTYVDKAGVTATWSIADNTNPAGLLTGAASGNEYTLTAKAAAGVAAGTYKYTVKANEVTHDVTVTVSEPTFEIEAESNMFEDDSPVENHTYTAVFVASGAEGEVTWTLDDKTKSGLYSYKSGDKFVVEGVAKVAQDADENDEDQTFTVTAKSGNAASEPLETTFTVEAEDEDIKTRYEALTPTAGAHNAVKSDYVVSFPKDVVADPDSVWLPSWLAPVMGTTEDTEDYVVGIKFAGVAGDLENDKKATVRVEAEYIGEDDLKDDDDGYRYYAWDVTYEAAPEKLALTLTPATLALKVGETKTAAATATNAQGDVTFTLSGDVPSWLTINATGTITAANPTAEGSYNVTVVAKDSRGEAGQATAPLAVTVTKGDEPTPTPTTLTITVNPTSVTFDSPTASAKTVALSSNLTGTTFSATVSPTSGLTAAVSGGTLTLTPSAAGSYTVTVTGTNGTQTKTATVSVTVDEEDEPTPVGQDFMLQVTGSTTLSVALNATNTSITLTPRNVQGTVSYTSSATWVTVGSDGKVTIAPKDVSLVGTQKVTITAKDAPHATGNDTDTVTLTITVTSGGGKVGSSGGGCDAGFGALALALAAPLFLRRRRS